MRFCLGLPLLTKTFSKHFEWSFMPYFSFSSTRSLLPVSEFWPLATFCLCMCRLQNLNVNVFYVIIFTWVSPENRKKKERKKVKQRNEGKRIQCAFEHIDESASKIWYFSLVKAPKWNITEVVSILCSRCVLCVVFCSSRANGNRHKYSLDCQSRWNYVVNVLCVFIFGLHSIKMKTNTRASHSTSTRNSLSVKFIGFRIVYQRGCSRKHFSKYVLL